jgi:galactokinase
MTVDRARAVFARAYGRSPRVVASAPGRVNLIGEHTDYNGGDVLPMATELRTYVAMDLSHRPTSRATSASQPAMAVFSIRGVQRAGAWWDYVAGPLAVLVSLGIELPEADIAVVSSVPAGAGLASSAALELATLVAMAALCEAGAGMLRLARVAQRAEREFVGVRCGIMDQFASALSRTGHALLIACDTEVTEQVPFADAVLIFDTAVPRDLLHTPYETRRRECGRALNAIRARFPEVSCLGRASVEQVRESNLSPPFRERAIHVVDEVARVGHAVTALRATGRLPGELLFASHRSLRELYRCSTPQLDWFVEQAAGRDGITGARLTGAGWGGCAVAVGLPDALRALAGEMEPAYRETFGHPARWWITRAAAGASVDWVDESRRHSPGTS